MLYWLKLKFDELQELKNCINKIFIQISIHFLIYNRAMFNRIVHSHKINPNFF